MAFSSAYCQPLPPANSTLKRFDGRYWHLDFPLSSICTIVSESETEFEVNCEFRSNRDLAGILWTSADKFGHPVLAYVNDRNYSGVKLGFIANPLDPWNFTVTFSGNGSGQVYRLFPYKISGGKLVSNVTDSLNQGNGTGLSYDVSAIFPDGAPSLNSGEQYFIIDFDNIYLGYNYEKEKVDPTIIDQLFISIVPPSFGLGANAYLQSEGEVHYYGNKLAISGVSNIKYWTIRNVNPNLRLAKGDIIQASIAQPLERSGQENKETPTYTYENVIMNIQVTEWTGDGTSTRRIKIDNGGLNGVAFIGSRASSVLLNKDTAIGNETVYFKMRGISTTGSRRMIGRRFYPQPVHRMEMTSGYDDTYNITPYRQVDNTYNLGYRGHFTIYMGMSHYFKAFSTGGAVEFVNKVVKDAEEPLNYPTVVWCRNLFEQMQTYGYTFIWSTSYEILNSYMPEEWKQRDAFGSPALSGWSPPSSFIVITNTEVLDYMGRVINHGLKLLDEAGITKLMFQIGEPWWWDGSYTNGAPCIYDELTKSMYKAETGNDVPTPYYTDYRQPITPEQLPYLEWLGDKLGQSTNHIRDYVKNVYPDSEATLLFFTPQIMNPTSEFLRIINFPINYWIYPNYDFVQIEDYDWIINGELELLPLTIEAAVDRLGYPLDVVHYFIGFVNSAYQTWVWASMNIATRNAIEWEIPYIYVWAYPQVIRDGILYDDSVIGNQPAVQPPLTPLRQIDHIDDSITRPVFMVKIGDDTFINSGDKNINYGGNVYYGVASLGALEPLIENMAGGESGWLMTLQGIPTLLVEEAAESLRNKKVTMFLTLVDNSGYMITDPKIIGEGDVLDNNIQFENNAATIAIRVRSGLADWARASQARYTDNFQKVRYPDDDGFIFMGSMPSLKLEWGQ
ncbi:hypothetical protein FDJ62_gp17 [Acinetobacter phage Loki]|uniref:Capsid and scaffold protein n=1 Tax=Acinetobacter phage Loki TaxID=1970374 RepID=A0A0P1KKK5_9CAUD|nr:hypothetical protein FDJ62_gp17 [Acinetobacter phage Loki]CUS06478.1 hypothetical protein [Acinetobacter phage Loki]